MFFLKKRTTKKLEKERQKIRKRTLKLFLEKSFFYKVSND